MFRSRPLAFVAFQPVADFDDEADDHDDGNDAEHDNQHHEGSRPQNVEVHEVDLQRDNDDEESDDEQQRGNRWEQEEPPARAIGSPVALVDEEAAPRPFLVDFAVPDVCLAVPVGMEHGLESETSHPEEQSE